MPVSSESGKADIKRIIHRIKPKTGLDIGVGCGTYAKLFPDVAWSGVEIWEPYDRQYGLKNLYRELYIADARTWEAPNRYDVAILGDVLEHMSTIEAVAVFKNVRACSDVVIASIPIGHWPQGAVGGNPHETHRHDWTENDVYQLLGPPTWSMRENEIGVYVWSNSDKFWPEFFAPIPKTLHFVWIGDETKRPDRFIDSWREKNPTWRVKVWGNAEFQQTNWINRPHMNAMLGQLHGVADLMRYEILYNEGGVALDADCECLRPLEDRLFEEVFVSGYENEPTRPGMVAVGMMASVPRNPFLRDLIYSIKLDPDVPNNVAWISTGPMRLTNFIDTHKPTNIKLWPSHYFIPNHFDAPAYAGSDLPFARQYWGTTTEQAKAMEKKKPKICVYAIAKNEEQFVERFCDAAGEADLILIADTGSTDKTVMYAENLLRAVAVHHIHVNPWRFDLARNAALALIPKDMDICISLDLDEILQPGWREEIERVWEVGKTTRLRYKFDWGAGIVFYYEKIHARNGYFWHHPCHEYPTPDGRITEVWASTDMLIAVHKPDPKKSRGQYLDLLALSVQEDPHCPRNAFYYARELTFHHKWQEAITAAKRYLDLPRATWINERCYAYRVMGQSYAALGDQWQAEVSYRRACDEAPGTREPWCDLAMLLYRQSRWAECYACCVRALAITDRQLVYTCDPAVWGHWAHDLASISAWHMGLYDVAVAQAKLALEKTPTDPRLRANLEYVLKDQAKARPAPEPASQAQAAD